MCSVPPLHLQWWKPVTSTAEPFTILSLLKEQGSILKLCWEGKEKKNKTEGQVFNDKVSSRAKMLWRESCCLYSWTAQFRAFKAIKSHLWQSWGMISAQDCFNVKLEATDLVFVFLVHLEEPEMSFMSCHSGPTDVPVGRDVLSASLPAGWWPQDRTVGNRGRSFPKSQEVHSTHGGPCVIFFPTLQPLVQGDS